MAGFPPAQEGQVTLANWRNPPFNRWAFHHVRELLPTAEIANDPDEVWRLRAEQRDIDKLFIERGAAGSISFDAFLSYTSTDGIVILHRGRIVHESFRNGMQPETPHILMSVSKSILGLLAGALAKSGALDAASLVTDTIPELRDTGYAGTTIRQLLDMRAGVAFDEDYDATTGPMVAYRRATGWNPVEPGEPPRDLRSFYRQMRARRGPHGAIFDYVSPNTDLLGWVIERSTGRRYAELMSELLWRPMGAARSAYITVDRLGAPRCAGGMCATIRDLARVGQLIVEGGSREGREVVPTDWIEDIVRNGDADAWAAGNLAHYFPHRAMHYRSQWYVARDTAPLLMALGIHGQHLFVDREREIVIAKVSSQPLPLDAQCVALTLDAAAQIREWLG
jgi:CubicO group peptidase (beta-lactamase class C family)